MRILVVEDDQDLLTATVRRLISAGFEVLSAFNGNDALTLLKSGEAVDALFSDLLLPGMSGLELAHQTKRHWRIPVILTSGPIPLDSDLPGNMQFIKKNRTNSLTLSPLFARPSEPALPFAESLTRRVEIV